MSEEDDGPNKQIEPIHLDNEVKVFDQSRHGKTKNYGWVTIRELGKGAFGTVYHVINDVSKEEAALKLETKTAGDNLLKIEREIMSALQHEPSAIHVKDDGIFGDYRFIVMTLCGLDLEKVSIAMNGKFSQETVLRVAIRTLLPIKILHEAEYVHRDLKPCNFALDYQPTSHNIYLFDYGMARKYARKERNGYILRRPRAIAQFRGTVQYCSLNMHKLKELGRVDDLWSWLFMAAEMVVPLPWNKVQRADLAEVRKEDRLNDYFSNDPFLASAFQPIYHLLGTYEFADRPDYAKIFVLLHTKLKEIGGTLTGPMEYDRIRLSPKQNEQIKSTMKSLHLNPKEPPKVEDEQTAFTMLDAQFKKPGVPGGQLLVMPEAADFFGNLKIAEERTDEMPKKKPVKEGKEQQSNVDAKRTRGKMLGPVKPSTAGGPGVSARSSQVVSKQGTKKSKGTKKKQPEQH